MEKFGIFELLDALAALTEGEEGQGGAQQDPPPAGKKLPDETFRAPDYGDGESGKNEPAARDGSAIGGFLSRHDEISKKAKK